MKYVGNKIVYEIGDWVTCIRNSGSAFSEDKVYKVRKCDSFLLEVELDDLGCKSNGWNVKNFRPATQSEIDAYTKSQKPEFKVGDWVKSTETDNQFMMKIKKIDKETFFGSGISWRGDWIDSSDCLDFSDLRLATEKEIKEVLVAEAKRRGFVEGVTIKGSGINAQFSPGILEPINGEFYYAYDKEGIREILDTKDGKGFVYENGKWAEILEDIPVVIGDHTAYWDGVYLKVGCKTFQKNHVIQLRGLMETMNIEDIQVAGHRVSYFQVEQILGQQKNK